MRCARRSGRSVDGAQTTSLALLVCFCHAAAAAQWRCRFGRLLGRTASTLHYDLPLASQPSLPSSFTAILPIVSTCFMTFCVFLFASRFIFNFLVCPSIHTRIFTLAPVAALASHTTCPPARAAGSLPMTSVTNVPFILGPLASARSPPDACRLVRSAPATAGSLLSHTRIVRIARAPTVYRKSILYSDSSALAMMGLLPAAHL